MPQNLSGLVRCHKSEKAFFSLNMFKTAENQTSHLVIAIVPFEENAFF